MRPAARQAGLAAIVAAAVAGASMAPALAQPMPPPPGYQPGYAYGSPDVPPPEDYGYRSRRYDDSRSARDEDRRYAEAAEHWAAESCVEERDRNVAAGAVIGGVFGALLGSGVAGPHDRGAGAVVGGLAGALAGSAIGASATSPGCPPGYVVRYGAPPFAPPVFVGGYAYTAPPGYRPWIWDGRHWGYRPYPYHRSWYQYERLRR